MNAQPFALSFGHFSLVALGLLIYVLTNRINHPRRSPSSALAWVLLLMAFPYLGIPLYLFFGARKATKNSALRHAQWGSLISPDDSAVQNRMPAWAHSVLKAIDAPPVVWSAEAAFEADGRIALLSVLELIDSARSELAVSTYILGNDEIASRIMDALVVAAHRGVKVRLIVDAIGSLSLSRANIFRLQRGSVHIKRFMPIIRNPVKGRTNLRNHRKYIIADGEQLWAGGRNLAQEYFLDSADHPAWLDMSFRATGDIAKVMLEVFNSDWAQASNPRRIGTRKISSEAITHGAIDAFYRMQETWHQVAGMVRHSIADTHPAENSRPPAQAAAMPPSWPLRDLRIQVIPSGPDHLDDTIHMFLITAIFQARESFTAITPYFVPDDAMISALCLAARRGIRVTLMVPARSNHGLADLARSRALRLLAQAGAQIMLVNAMVHAKVYIIDEQIALTGSANLDMRSLFINYEVLTAFCGSAAIAWLQQWIAYLQGIASPFDPSPPGFAKDLLEGIVRSVAFEL